MRGGGGADEGGGEGGGGRGFGALRWVHCTMGLEIGSPGKGKGKVVA